MYLEHLKPEKGLVTINAQGQEPISLLPGAVFEFKDLAHYAAYAKSMGPLLQGGVIKVHTEDPRKMKNLNEVMPAKAPEAKLENLNEPAPGKGEDVSEKKDELQNLNEGNAPAEEKGGLFHHNKKHK